MKLIICLAALLATSFNANACEITFYSASSDVKSVLAADEPKFKDQGSICRRLKKAGAVILITGRATVLGNKSIGWASVGVKDRDSHISTFEYGGVATKMSDHASIDTARGLLLQAIDDAVNSLLLDRALSSLDQARTKGA